jgi:hypothetical protein
MNPRKETRARQERSRLRKREIEEIEANEQLVAEREPPQPQPLRYKKFVDAAGYTHEEVVEETVQADAVYTVISDSKGKVVSTNTKNFFGKGKKTVTDSPLELITFSNLKNKALGLPAIYGSLIPPENEKNTLDNFDPNTPSRVELKNTAEKALSQDQPEGLVVYTAGEAGCGKTHISVGLAKAFVERKGKSVFFGRQGFTNEPGSLDGWPDCAAIFLDDLPLPNANDYYSVQESKERVLKKQVVLHSHLLKFLSWQKYALDNNKILWITSNQLEVEALFNKTAIENTINTLKNAHGSSIDLDALIRFKESINPKSFIQITVKANPGEKKRRGLADALKIPTAQINLQSILEAPGEPPGILLLTPDEYQRLEATLKKWQATVVSPNIGLGGIPPEAKILIIDLNDSTPDHQLVEFPRNAWEDGRLLILKSSYTANKAKERILDSLSCHPTHQGKAMGNKSRLDSMLITFSELPQKSAECQQVTSQNTVTASSGSTISTPVPDNGKYAKEIENKIIAFFTQEKERLEKNYIESSHRFKTLNAVDERIKVLDNIIKKAKNYLKELKDGDLKSFDNCKVRLMNDIKINLLDSKALDKYKGWALTLGRLALNVVFFVFLPIKKCVSSSWFFSLEGRSQEKAKQAYDALEQLRLPLQ